jgi:hypothetical protein
MSKDSNFNATCAGGAAPTRRSPAAFEALLGKASTAKGQALRQTLHKVPDSRPEAVALARKLIADPGYPPPHIQKALAQHLAVQLTADMDPLP